MASKNEDKAGFMDLFICSLYGLYCPQRIAKPFFLLQKGLYWVPIPKKADFRCFKIQEKMYRIVKRKSYSQIAFFGSAIFLDYEISI